MEVQDYQENTAELAVYPSIEGHKFVYPLIGLAGEVGEILNKLKKIFRDNDGILSEETRQAFKSELGDVAWYLSQSCNELGFSLEEVLQANLDKLNDRADRGVIQGSGDVR